MIKLKWKNERRIMNAFRKAPKGMEQACQKALDRVAVKTLSNVKDIISRGTDMWKRPIDTGAMRAGIGVKRSGLRAVISPASSTPYAIYVHDGTRKMKARPFFEITKRHKEKDIIKEFQKEIEKVVKKIK